MDITQAIDAFTALSQKTRLEVLKILLEYGRNGAAAGVISERLGIAHNTLSFHLSNLKQAGLVTVRKDGRSMIYTAQVDTIEALIAYLKESCCVLDTDNTQCKPTSTH